MTASIHPFDAVLGAEVRGIDLSRPMDSDSVHATSPEFLYLHRWRVGDLLMWDNVATQHIAEFNYALSQRRYLHRTTLEGVALA